MTLIHVVTSSSKEFTGYFSENDSDGKCSPVKII